MNHVIVWIIHIVGEPEQKRKCNLEVFAVLNIQICNAQFELKVHELSEYCNDPTKNNVQIKKMHFSDLVRLI